MIKKYYRDNRVYNFSANITSVSELDNGKFNITLDGTYFYPEGGGQPADKGLIDGIKVLDVQKNGDNVLHTLEKQPLNLLDVNCEIDRDNRNYFMVQHTGQHLISAVLKHELDINTLSVHFGDDYTTIEIDRESITDKEIEKIEDKVFQLICNNNKVIYHETDDEGLKNFNIRRESKFSGYIRIVEIVGYDSVPCGGVHLSNLCEIGLVKITGSEKIRGNIRLTILIGVSAYKDYQLKNSVVNSLNSNLSTTPETLIEGVSRLKNTIGSLKLEKKDLIDSYSRELIISILEKSNTTFVFNELPKELIQKVATKLVGKLEKPTILLNTTGDILQWVLLDSKINLVNFQDFRTNLLPIINGKGGGKKDIWQGSGNSKNLDNFISNFKSWI